MDQIRDRGKTRRKRRCDLSAAGFSSKHRKSPNGLFLDSKCQRSIFSYQNTWHGGTSHTCTVIYSYRMTSPKTGIHHWCWEHIPRDLKKKKRQTTVRLFPQTRHCDALADSFSAIKVLRGPGAETLWESNSGDWRDFFMLLFLFYLFLNSYQFRCMTLAKTSHHITLILRTSIGREELRFLKNILHEHQMKSFLQSVRLCVVSWTAPKQSDGSDLLPR